MLDAGRASDVVRRRARRSTSSRLGQARSQIRGSTNGHLAVEPTGDGGVEAGVCDGLSHTRSVDTPFRGLLVPLHFLFRLLKSPKPTQHRQVCA